MPLQTLALVGTRAAIPVVVDGVVLIFSPLLSLSNPKIFLKAFLNSILNMV